MKDTLLVGDGHFGTRNDSVDFLEYQLDFFENQLIPYCVENKIRRIIYVGDLFDKRKSTNTHTLHVVRTRIVETISKMGITQVFDLGNHDLYYRDSLAISTPVEFFAGRYKNVYVITKPTTVKIGGAKVDIIPWICKENSSEVMQFISASTSDVCIGHFELQGFRFAKGGQICDAGLSPKVLRKYAQVYSGHFHGESTHGNIKYLGVPYQLTAADLDDPKGFYRFNDEDFSAEFIRNPNDIFHKVIYNDEENKYGTPKIADFTKYKNGMVKLIIEKSKSKAKFAKFRDMFYQVGVLKLDIIENSTGYAAGTPVEITDKMSDTKKLISSSVEQLTAPDIDHKRLQNMMEDIHSRALEKRSTL